MVMRLKKGTTLNGYVIGDVIDASGAVVARGEPSPDSFIIRYLATDSNGKPVVLRQYKSPGVSACWFADYVTYQKAVARYLGNSTTVKAVCESTLDVFAGSTSSDGREHPELFRITTPMPTLLSTLLGEKGLSPVERLDTAKRVSAALATLHSEGIVRVDISPWSVGLNVDGLPVFLNLDWVYIPGAGVPWDGDQGEVFSPGYGAPEVMDGERATVASDVYSLGLLLADLLASRRTRAGTGDFSGAGSSFSLLKNLPNFDRKSVSRILEACLDENPANRPTAEEVCSALAGSETSWLDVPRWISQPLQTLAFWVAYQNEIYRHHPLPEGALVAELTRLIDSAVGHDMLVVREPMYRDVLPQGSEDWQTRGRADMAVIGREQSSGHGCHAIVEVKRADAPMCQLDNDLRKLALYKQANKNARAFIVVVAQAGRPDRWVADDGVAVREEEVFDFTSADDSMGQTHLNVTSRVRLVKKASGSFISVGNASYCCLIEVL